MANVHFIWWGPFTAKAVARPLQFAQLCPQHQVYFWCQDSATVLPAFYLALSGSAVKLRGCSSVRRIVGDAAFAADPLFARTQAVVDELDHFRANAAVKDLLTTVVLHAHGGYYFDTSVELAPDATDGSRLRRALAVTYPNARVAQVAANSGREQLHRVGLMAPAVIAGGHHDDLGHDAPAQRAARGFVYVRSVDVWAQYSPQGDVVPLRGMTSYVQRAEIMGLYSGAVRGRGRQILDPTPGIPRATGSPELLARNKLIGQLAIQSTLDAFLYREPGQQDVPFDLPYTVVPDAAGIGRGHLGDFGLTKVFGGTWRIQTAAGAAAPAAPRPAPVPAVAAPPVAVAAPVAAAVAPTS